MKKNIIKGMAAAALLSATGAVAQTGYLFSRAGYGITDMVEISNYNFGTGSARSVAMGGAFTSLGGDVMSYHLNPAGLGMYRSSEFTISPTLTISAFDNLSLGATFSGANSRTQFTLGNIGFTLNSYQGSGALTSFSWGLSVNRLADYNFKAPYATAPDGVTIGDVFANQIYGLDVNLIRSPADPYMNPNIPTQDWGAVMAYKTSLMDTRPGSDYEYYVSPDILADGSQITHNAIMDSRGGLDEVAFGGGFNFGNKVYAGFSFGFTNYDVRQKMMYDEYYLNNAAPDPITSMTYDQRTDVSATGFNMKFGAMAVLAPGLRLGLAVHTPTWYSVEKSYSAAMNTYFANGDWGDTPEYPEAYYKYNFRTPPRLMAGLSYTIGEVGVVSFDWERTWYNAIRFSSDVDASGAWGRNTYADVVKTTVKDEFKARDIFRVGAEVKPLPELSLRAGFAYLGSFLRNDKAVYDSPVAYKGMNVTCGVGMRITPQIYLDLAYAYMKTEYTQTDLYYDYDDMSLNPEYGIDSKQNRNNVILTFGVRF